VRKGHQEREKESDKDREGKRERERERGERKTNYACINVSVYGPGLLSSVGRY